MTAITVDLDEELAEGLARAADQRRTSPEALLVAAARRLIDEDASEHLEPNPAEVAAMRRALDDVQAGRLIDHDAVFNALDAKHGWR